MLKFIFSLLVILFLMLSGIYFLLFTNTGNNFLKPYASEYLSFKIGKKVVFDKFIINPNDIDIKAVVDSKSYIDVKGVANIIKRSFDLVYHIEAEGIKTPKFTIKDKLLINGKAKGNIDNFIITGEGEALKSNLQYSVNIIDNNPANINIDIDKGSIEEALLLAGQGAYANGKFDLHIKMPKYDSENLNINAQLNIQNGFLNETLIKKEFDISLPKGAAYHGNVFASADHGNIINIKGDLFSTLANMKIKNGHFNVKNQSFDSAYILDIKDLSKIEPIVNKKLKGDLIVKGTIQKSNNNLVLDGTVNEFGGKVDFVMKNIVLDMKATDVSVVKVANMLRYPKVFEAVAEADIKYNLLTKKGVIDANMHSARALKSQFTTLLAKFTNTDLTQEKFNDTTFNAKIDKENVDFTFLAKSKKSHITLKESKLNTKTNQVNATFDVNIKEKDFKGTIKGDINKPKIALEGSSYLKQKATKEISKIIDKHLGGSDENGSDKAKPVKDLLKMFLK